MRTIKHIFISAALLTGFASCDLNPKIRKQSQWQSQLQ